MEYTPAEKEALKILNMESFKNPTKEKLMSFVSMIPNMDKEVALAAISHFPEMANVISDMVKDCKDVILKDNDLISESQKSCLDSYDVIIEACKSKITSTSTLDSDKYYIDKMFEAASKKDAKETEGKKFVFSREQLLGLGLVFTAGVVATFLSGGKISIPKSFKL